MVSFLYGALYIVATVSKVFESRNFMRFLIGRVHDLLNLHLLASSSEQPETRNT